MSKTKDAMMEFTNGFYHTDRIWGGCGWRKPPKRLRVNCPNFTFENKTLAYCEGENRQECDFCHHKKEI